jgi:ArsR family transcriptional regulator, virulence genes transcriptional regulator
VRVISEASASITDEDVEKLGELHGKATHAVELLKAMANEWRLMILCQLAEGEKTVSELQDTLGLSQSALSQHLAVLRRERIVSSRKHAQSVSYSLAGADAPKVMQALHEVFCETRGERSG